MKQFAMIIMLAFTIGCGSSTPPPAPTDAESIKASQDEQRKTAGMEGESQKVKK